MFSSRNIHFILLGIILGAACGYIFAFYQVQTSMALPAASSNTTQEHPKVTNDQIIALFKTAIERNPNQPELMTRYANFLSTIGKYSEAIEWYEKTLAIQPNDLDLRADLGTAYWNVGQMDKAMAEYQKSLAMDPRHIPSLHNMFLLQVEGQHDLQAATRTLKKIEEIDPNYQSLAELKNLLEDNKPKVR